MNSHPMRDYVFTISHQAIAWKAPMVSVSESNPCGGQRESVEGKDVAGQAA